MFTGIVEEIGRIRRAGSRGLKVEARRVLADLKVGDSVAVNGVCLTVVDFDHASFSVDVMPETLRRSNLASLHEGSRVNLERALSPTSRLGGHFVQGHIDGTGRVIRVQPEGDALRVWIQAAPEITRYVVEKGFIAVDGASLTIVDAGAQNFSVSLVSFTQQTIVLAECRAGDVVNLEVDILGKYVERFVKRAREGEAGGAISAGGIDEEFLSRHGFT